jgi:hypothetical protein
MMLNNPIKSTIRHPENSTASVCWIPDNACGVSGMTIPRSLKQKGYILALIISLLPFSFAYSATDYLKSQDQIKSVTTASRDAQKDHRNGTADSDPFAALNTLMKQGLGLNPNQIPVQTAPAAPTRQPASVPKPAKSTVRPTEPTEAGISGIPDTNNDEQQNDNDNNVQLNF